jgi:hypothetical protein
MIKSGFNAAFYHFWKIIRSLTKHSAKWYNIYNINVKGIGYETQNQNSHGLPLYYRAGSPYGDKFRGIHLPQFIRSVGHKRYRHNDTVYF